MKGHTFWSDLKNYRVLLLMLAPAVAFFFCLPMSQWRALLLPSSIMITRAVFLEVPGTGSITSDFSLNREMPGG